MNPLQFTGYQCLSADCSVIDDDIFRFLNPCLWKALVSNALHIAALLAAKPAVATRIFSAAVAGNANEINAMKPINQ